VNGDVAIVGSSSTGERGRALALLALCGLFWSSAGVLIHYVSWHPLAIWSARCGIAGLTLTLIARPHWRGITPTELGVAVTHAATTGLFIAANKLTTPANAILIQYSAPVWVALFGSVILGERASRLDWATIVVVLGGIALFFLDQLQWSTIVGNLVALAAGVAFALNIMLLRKVARGDLNADNTQSRPQPLRSIILGNLLGFVIGAPFCFLYAAPGATGWAALLALGIFQQAAAYLCYGWAIKRATALEGLLIPVIEPILSPVWVMLVFGQRPGPWALVGGIVVISAVTLRALAALR
jgi:drug/metabolite transporter (DMT)-like permease